jgi:hypothetical protein
MMVFGDISFPCSRCVGYIHLGSLPSPAVVNETIPSGLTPYHKQKGWQIIM